MDQSYFTVEVSMGGKVVSLQVFSSMSEAMESFEQPVEVVLYYTDEQECSVLKNRSEAF